MRVIRHPEVPPELEGAALWYEERQAGLGGDFLAEYEAALGRILEPIDHAILLEKSAALGTRGGQCTVNAALKREVLKRAESPQYDSPG